MNRQEKVEKIIKDLRNEINKEQNKIKSCEKTFNKYAERFIRFLYLEYIENAFLDEKLYNSEDFYGNYIISERKINELLVCDKQSFLYDLMGSFYMRSSYDNPMTLNSYQSLLKGE